ncbi:MAG: MarR family transcriptional regulator, partial [Solirubrobacterales bacterium]|nr:MarR family transcriptional regulator [Solirubrobacterales bacterium]
GTLALLTQLSRSTYRAANLASGGAARMKQLVALSHLRELGPVAQSQLGTMLCLDANNTVLLLNELESAGLVVRKRCESDRRRHQIELTDQGFEVLRHIELELNAVEDEVLAALDEDQRAQFQELLHQAVHGERGVLARARADVALS